LPDLIGGSMVLPGEEGNYGQNYRSGSPVSITAAGHVGAAELHHGLSGGWISARGRGAGPKSVHVIHELAHVAQYERLGGFREFLKQYLEECINPGYPLGDLELEAKQAESLASTHPDI
jgi:hypothetical protein